MLMQILQRHLENRKEFYEYIAIPSALLSGIAVTLLLNDANQALFLYLNDLGRAMPNTLWASLTVLGDGWVAIVLGLILSIYQPRLLFPVLLAIILALLATHLLKWFFAVPRPADMVDPGVIHIIGQKLTAHNSFPSGHTITAFTLCGLVALHFRDPRLLGLLFICALLIGLSRIFVGAHWPADVMFGGAVGWFIAWLALKIAAMYSVNNWRQQPRLISKTLFLLIAIALFWHKTHYDAANWLVYIIAGGASMIIGGDLILAMYKMRNRILSRMPPESPTQPL